MKYCIVVVVLLSVQLAVNMQACGQVLESLRGGDFGQVSEETIEDYRTRCHAIFPYANAFMLDLPNGTVEEETLMADSDAAAAADTDCIDCVA